MKVVILCGGKGERLREETEFKPKPLIEIGGMPILWHIMKIYSHYGHKEFVLLLGYKGSMIKEFFLNFEYLCNDFTLHLRKKERVIFHRGVELEDWTIHFVDTGIETNTGGRIARARHIIGDEDFFLTYGDGLADVNLHHLLEYHRSKGRILTVTGVTPSSQYGIMTVNEGIACSFCEKPPQMGLINGGYMVATPRLFEYLSPDVDCVFEQKPLQTLAQEGQIAVYHHSSFWHAMDTYKQVVVLNQLWNQPHPPWKVWT